ncbi:aromatic-L-amino-acid decarboxylase [Exophiala aquamarina CBS 119918]|uniref:Aromatic-L-amino-acid decarboxylase n=1 Tax=Exophiala aquamarina CBS 119918 TaxID=1182545 RepID=A0A072PH42_9EURO|nr:aromatic-L-amino-acid decarboxylase [Exophiala aquamarina CBS 119918]KEF59077.1 aromatic-L-amino-acid decarboxylase [Exophiala aquamarina CBS 119918]
MDADEFRKAAHAAIEEIRVYHFGIEKSSPRKKPLTNLTCRAVIAYNQNIENYPVLPTIKPGFLAPQLPKSAPEEPQPWTAIQPDIASKIVPGLTHWQSPNFMAFFPAGVTYPSMLGEIYSAAFTAPAFNWLCSPACTELETVVMDWLAQAFDLPKAFLSTSPNGGGGTIQGSASEAIVTCMVAARERYLHARCDAEGLAPESKERENRITSLRGRLVALSSDQAHSSTQKGALIAGTRYRSIPTKFENELSLQAPDLEAALKQCQEDGLEPYYITLTLGTTSTCAVDDFERLASVLKKSNPNVWIHVDAAYAGAALVCPEFSSQYSASMIHVDSFNMNMHKWLLVNFDASCLFVQNRSHLTRALSISAAYYVNKHSDSGLVTDYRDWQIPLGRRFRALKIWFVMRSYGISGLQAHIRNSVRIGGVFVDLVRSRSDLYEIVATPRFALTCFRVKPEVVAALQGVHRTGETGEDFEPMVAAVQQKERNANQITTRIGDLINERGEIFLTCSSTGGKSFIRVVSGNPNAEEKYIRAAFDIIVRTTEEVLEANRSGEAKGTQNGYAN